MSHSELTLYPKSYYIHKLILQIVLAVVMILALLNLWLSVSVKNHQMVEENFNQVGQAALSQAGIAVTSILASGNASQLQAYISQLGQSAFIKEVHLYDTRGKLIAQSEQATKVNSLYNLSELENKLSSGYVPFVQEIRGDKLQGYLRLTIEKTNLTGPLRRTEQENQHLLRYMLIITLVIGLLITRSLSRFGRTVHAANAKAVTQ
jgi:membrane protein